MTAGPPEPASEPRPSISAEVEGSAFLSEVIMQELLLVGLIDLAVAALASLPFWFVVGLRRRRPAQALVRTRLGQSRWSVREA